jgi:hypothetical protein
MNFRYVHPGPGRPSSLILGICLLALASVGTRIVWGSTLTPTDGAQAATARTWFVRSDGGDRKQCTGKADTAYKGQGTNRPCAFKDPQYLFTNDEYGNKGWIVAGGDTVILRGGPFRMGYRGPNAGDRWGLCPGDPFGCSMPPVPSGTAANPTRILGEHFADCSAKTQLFGGYGLGVVLDLASSKHVDVECLELTDHGQCSRVGAGDPQMEKCSSSYPLSDYAGTGILTNQQTSDLLLKNLDIHGFTSRGILGAIGGEVIVSHVRIAYNGGAGWDFDDGKGTSSATNAFVHASNLLVEWNGCNEEYPITHPHPARNCFDQDHGGYGDGVGTPDTALNFSCDHCIFRYNTQDGLDLLHTSGSAISITNSESYGNMGQQWKMGAMRSVIFRNNVTIHNCSRLGSPMSGAPEGYNRGLSLFCRAAGDGIAFATVNDGSYVLQNNTYLGYGTTSYDITCNGSCSKPNIIFQNNLHIGYKNPKDGRFPALFYTSNLPKNPFLSRDHNLYFRMRTCPSGSQERCIDPQLIGVPSWTDESSLDTVDLHLSAQSSARGSGVKIPEIGTDITGAARPDTAASDIGAFAFHP